MSNIKLLILLITIISFAQKSIAQDKSIQEIRSELKNAKAQFKGKQPKYKMGDLFITTLKGFDSTQITSIKAIPIPKAIKLFGADGKNGVIELEIIMLSIDMSGPVNLREFSLSPEEIRNVPEPKKENTDKTDIYSKTEIEPKYIGNLIKFINLHLKYPYDALDEGIQGKVVLNYIVELDSSISNITISENSPTRNNSLVQESIRVIKKTSGNWIPGVQNGKSVRCTYETEINFVIPEDNDIDFPYCEGFSNFIDSAMQYPKQAIKKKIYGEVLLNFIVTEKGTIEDIILSPSSKTTDAILVKEAMRILKLSSGRWKPATKNNVPCSKAATTSIYFKPMTK
jgi:TonB family protein